MSSPPHQVELQAPHPGSESDADHVVAVNFADADQAPHKPAAVDAGLAAPGAIDLDALFNMNDAELNAFVDDFPLEAIPELSRQLRARGSVEPPSNLSFRSLFYRKQGVVLVNGVSGYVQPGDKVAVIGEGSTPLLEAIAGRAHGGWLVGEILVNNRPPDESFKRVVGFVPKEDFHLPTMTVRETLLFSCRLRSKPEREPAMAPLDEEMGHAGAAGGDAAQAKDHEELRKRRHDILTRLRVELVMKVLGLRHRADSIVGNASLRGISGGEKRRLSLAVEIVAGHSIIVADQPTNGLDSKTALGFLETTAMACQAGSSVIYSVAQPSPELLAKFDKVLLLSRGATIYFGPLNEAEAYFAKLGFFRKPESSVPEFLEELAKTPDKFTAGAHPHPSVLSAAAVSASNGNGNGNDDDDDDNDDDEERSHHASATFNYTLRGMTLQDPESRAALRDAWTTLTRAYKRSSMNMRMGKKLWTELEPSFELEVEPEPEFNTSLLEQAKEVLVRQVTLTVRDRATMIGGLGKAIFMAVLLGAAFTRLPETQTGARSRIGLIFFAMMFHAMSSVQMVPLLMEQRSIFYQQKNAGYFRPLAYFVSLQLTTFMTVAVQVMLFSLVAYPFCGLNGDVLISGKWWFFALTLYTVTLTTRSIVLAIAAYSPTEVFATAVAPLIMTVTAIFAGFLLPEESIPVGWVWLYYLSPLSPALKALAINEYKGLTFRCRSDELVLGQCPLSNGDSVLTVYSMYEEDESEKWVLLGYLVIFFLVFNLLAAYLLSNVDRTGHVNVESAKKLEPVMDDYVVPIAASTMEASLAHSRGATLEFKDLTYDVDIKLEDGTTERRRLVDHAFGYSRPGELTCLLGASGAGKSTTLDVLAGKKNVGYIGGEILVNGRPKNAYFSRIAGYVEQTDSHDPFATVYEAVRFAADLRMPDASDDQKEKRVLRVLEQLELTSIADQLIGSVDTAGISPENRKKVTIAVELVAEPLILFLDEPTTGLTASGALAVMNSVRRLSAEMSCICTIHQPSSQIVNMFDRLLILQPGGTVTYFGPMAGVADYFGSLPGSTPMEAGRNIADFALEVGSARQRAAKEGDATDPSEEFLQSELGKHAMQQLEQGVAAKNANEVEFDRIIPTTFNTQFLVLLRRFFLGHMRDMASTGVRFGSPVVMGIIFGTMYLDMGSSQSDANNRVSFAFLSMMFLFFGAQNYMPLFVEMRSVFYRETTNSMYSTAPYYLARVVADQPLAIVQATIYSTIIYWLAGLTSASGGAHFFAFVLVMYVVVNLGFASAELCVNATPNAQLAQILFTVIMSMNMLFAGFLLPKDGMADAWLPLWYVNVFRYPLFAVIANEVGQIDSFTCSSGEVCQYSDGDDLLDAFSIEDDFWGYLLSALGMLVGVRVIAYLLLRFIQHIKR